VSAESLSLHPLDPECLPAHLDRLHRAARSFCRSRDDAEDLVQETLLRVLARPRWLRQEDPLGYLLCTLRNLHFTRRAARPAPEPLDGQLEHVAAPPHLAAEVGEVLDAVRALPPPQRSVLAAIDVAGLSYRETADLLDIPLGTVMSRLHRARESVARGLS
jgi:RNA polymerase sigma-70 factor, ECF subfamily